jgi:hypothetical protein
MNIINRDPKQEDLDRAKQLIADGYYQISRKSRIVARLPTGMTGKQALKSVTPESRHYWVDAMRDSRAGEHYLRCYGIPDHSIQLDVPTFAAFRHLGGDTYQATHWESDIENVTTIPICEVDKFNLRPDRTYRFEVHQNCNNCKHWFTFATWRQPGLDNEQSLQNQRD